MTTINTSNTLTKATLPSGTSVAGFKHPDFEPEVRPKKPFLPIVKKKFKELTQWFKNLDIKITEKSIESVIVFLVKFMRGGLSLVAIAYIASPELLQDMPDTYWFISWIKVCVEWLFHCLRWLIENMISLLPF